MECCICGMEFESDDVGILFEDENGEKKNVCEGCEAIVKDFFSGEKNKEEYAAHYLKAKLPYISDKAVCSFVKKALSEKESQQDNPNSDHVAQQRPPKVTSGWNTFLYILAMFGIIVSFVGAFLIGYGAANILEELVGDSSYNYLAILLGVLFWIINLTICVFFAVFSDLSSDIRTIKRTLTGE